MKILLFGKNGQVGRRLCNILTDEEDLIALGSSDVDLKNASILASKIKEIKPDVIINAAAYTAVDAAEIDQEGAMAVNAIAPKIMAEIAKEIGALLVHYSTDYVFDGTKATPYTEDDVPSPINFYGYSKASGDEFIRSSGCKYLIIRTSWVYDSQGKNFFKTILSLAKKNKTINVVDDQIGSPTMASLIADATILILYKTLSSKENLCGIYNLVSRGYVSWYEFASYILESAEKAGINLECKSSALKAIASSEYKTAAVRPSSSMLDISKICEKFGVTVFSWQQYVHEVIEELKEMEQI